MTETFFTSDTHYGHDNIIKFCKRPFESSKEMDETLIENYNSLVTNKDLVYHLGDFSFLDKEKTRRIVSRLNGSIVLIRGNHDLRRLKLSSSIGFSSIKDYHELSQKEFGCKIVLMHYPILSWNKKKYNSIHCHGHTHSTEKSTGRRIDVGVDSNNLYPYHITEILEIANATVDP